MSEKQNQKQRLTRLVEEGKLQPQEAEALNAAMLPEVPRPEPESKQAYADNKFLRGEMTVAEFRAGGRRNARLLGILFGLIFGLMFPIVVFWSHPSVPLWIVSPVLIVLTGVGFGWGMYRTLIKPTIERQIQLRAQTGPMAALPSADANQCPECRSEEFDIQTWRSGVMMHWVFNPMLAFNELVFGQRIPSELRTCRHCTTASVGCPHCHCSIHCRHWSNKKAFGNYLGLNCPECGGRLPTLSNALAWLVRAPFVAVAWLLGRRPSVRKEVTQ